MDSDDSILFSDPQLPDPLDIADIPEIPGDWGDPSPRPRPAIVEQFVGVIRSGPCSGSSSDYSDARYYIDRSIPRTGSTLAAQTETIPGLKQCLTATNLAELADNTHLLTAGTLVQVFALYARGAGNTRSYVFNLVPASAVVVSITGNAGGDGEYDGQILGGASSADAGSGLAMPAGLTPGDNALIVNVEETGLIGHRIAAGSYAVGVVRGSTTETPPRAIVFIRGALGRTDSPKALGSGGVTPSTTTWSRNSDGTPLTLTVITSVVWDSTASTLLANTRVLTFDARGVLASVSAESQAVVDAATVC